MNKILQVIAVSALLSACGSGEIENPSSNGNNATTDGDVVVGVSDAGSTQEPTVSAALPEPVDTDTLTVDRSFDFATARSIDIDFNIGDAANDEASVSICTKYSSMDGTFDIDFDSCTVNGILNGGSFQHSMDVTIDKESVVAVVLFQDPTIAPMFKEFFVDASTRTKSDGRNNRVIVWNE